MKNETMRTGCLHWEGTLRLGWGIKGKKGKLDAMGEKRDKGGESPGLAKRDGIRKEMGFRALGGNQVTARGTAKGV